MKILFLISLMAFLLSGCILLGEPETHEWVQFDGSRGNVSRDYNECVVTAVRDIPANNRTVSSGVSTTTCSAIAGLNCVTRDPAAYTYDVNSEIRQYVFEECMKEKGWVWVRKRTLDRPSGEGSPVRQSLAPKEGAPNLVCRTDSDCDFGESCRSTSGGGTECRMRADSDYANILCRTDADCVYGKSCRSKSGGGTECR